MLKFYTVYETQQFIGDLITTTEYDQAKRIAEDFARVAFPDKKLQWVDEWQYMDRPGGTVYVKLMTVSIDDFSGYLHRRDEVQQFLKLRSPT